MICKKCGFVKEWLRPSEYGGVGSMAFYGCKICYKEKMNEL